MEISIRPWRLSDVEALAVNLNDREILDNLRDGLPFPYTAADARNYIAAMMAVDRDICFACAICLDDAAVGSLSISRGENIHCRTAELGYYLGREYWGRGIATAAVGEACWQVFNATDVLRIFAQPFAENAASCRVLEKNGFKLEGVLRANAIKNGRVRDMKMYSLIKEGI